MDNTVEITVFKLKDGICQNDMLAAARNMEENFFNKERTPIKHYIKKLNSELFLGITIAGSISDSQEIYARMMENSWAQSFLKLIDPIKETDMEHMIVGEIIV